MSLMFGLSMVFVTLRVIFKASTRTLCAEDHLLVISMVFSVVSLACVLRMAKLGFGGHVYDLKDGALMKILQLLYVAEALYIVSLAVIKCSIVMMYIRIFWTFRAIIIACYITLAFIIISNLVIFFLILTMCRPIPYYWDRDIALTLAASNPAQQATCLDVIMLAYVHTAFAAVQDIVLILLPVTTLWHLNMSRKRKVLVAGMFGVGSMGVVVTISRLSVVRMFEEKADITWDWVNVAYWTSAELATAAICSSLPAMRVLFERVARWLGFKSKGSKGGGDVAVAGGGAACEGRKAVARRKGTPRGLMSTQDTLMVDTSVEEGRCKDGRWLEAGNGSSDTWLTRVLDGDAITLSLNLSRMDFEHETLELEKCLSAREGV